VEKHLPSARIVLLSAVSCLLFAILVASPVVFVGAESGRADPAVEASMLAELHLSRAVDEFRRTGACPAEKRVIRCDECRENEFYTLDTRVMRDPSGRAERISVRVRWEGPIGGGAVVATGILDDYGRIDQEVRGGETEMSEKLADPEK
jgi:hypothetical protein